MDNHTTLVQTYEDLNFSKIPSTPKVDHYNIFIILTKIYIICRKVDFLNSKKKFVKKNEKSFEIYIFNLQD
jgi:hypothetical protein